MMKFGALLLLALSGTSDAFGTDSRRSFLANVGTTAAGAAGIVGSASLVMPSPVLAAPTILNTENGVKYAITKEATSKTTPQPGDIVAIEFTGYLSNGQVSCMRVLCTPLSRMIMISCLFPDCFSHCRNNFERFNNTLDF
jgi:nitrous oxide reductase